MFKKLQFWIIALPFILSLLITIIILTGLKFLPERLPLFYSLPWGDKQLATHQQFLIIPLTIAIVTLINLIISWQLHPSQALFKKALLISSIVLCLIMTIMFVKVILNFI